MDAQWREWAAAARRPVAITGAGISVASGLPTIKKEWRGVPLKEVFARKMFEQDPARFYECYREMLLDWRAAQPNGAHRALADRGVWVITQNFDGLHQKAGSKKVLEIHGNLRELICLGCASYFPSHVAETNPLPHCPTCDALLKPNIVLEGEEVRHFATAMDWVGETDLLLVVGTKLDMQPVGDLPKICEEKGVPVIVCNKAAETVLPELFRSCEGR